MGVLYSVGNALVEPLELAERAAAGPLIDFAEAARRGASVEIQLSTGRVNTAELREARSDPLGFEPIGMNKPLAVELLAAWSGDAPGRSLIDRVTGRGKPDLLVVSAAKAPQDVGAAHTTICVHGRARLRPMRLLVGSQGRRFMAQLSTQ